MSKFYVTSPIFYPNARPHLGHAYATLLCDALARSKKLQGSETYFVTGTDEHTEKVIKAAQAQNQSPESYLEEIVERFKELYKELDIDYSQFLRTSDKQNHWPGAREMWNRLVASGDLYKNSYVGLYCLGCEAFKTEKELVDGLCPDHNTKPQEVSEENYFFRLSKYASRIEELIESDTIHIVPATRKKEILSFIRSGVDDVSFSRPKEKMTWGIPVPGDDSQTMYIWADALTSYISALGFGRDEALMDFWPGTHIIGKDILRFHTVFWPAMLLSADVPLPKQILVHGTIISDGKKMSKTIGNVIDPNDLIQKYGTDATRYLLLRHVHPFEDSDITWDKLDEWYTADLVNGLGNLVSRVMKLSEEHVAQAPDLTGLALEDAFLAKLNEFDFQGAMQSIMEHVAKGDVYMTEKAPYKKVKDQATKAEGVADIERLVLHIAKIAVHLAPFMPATANAIFAALQANKKPENLFPRLG